MNMLNMQLPKMLPAAMSGTSWLMELMVVSSSGREVAAANSRVPMNMPPRPVRTAITSPYSDSLAAAATVTAALPKKRSQTPIMAGAQRGWGRGQRHRPRP